MFDFDMAQVVRVQLVNIQSGQIESHPVGEIAKEVLQGKVRYGVELQRHYHGAYSAKFPDGEEIFVVPLANGDMHWTFTDSNGVPWLNRLNRAV